MKISLEQPPGREREVIPIEDLYDILKIGEYHKQIPLFFNTLCFSINTSFLPNTGVASIGIGVPPPEDNVGNGNPYNRRVHPVNIPLEIY